MEAPVLISVIMPACNAEQYIAKSIETVINQTYPHWELIVVDDGSTDNTKQIVLQNVEKDKRIKYFYQSNSGQGKARNHGIKYASGDWIAFLDADDLWMPPKLELQLQTLILNEVDLIFSDVSVIDEKGIQIRNTWGVEQQRYDGVNSLVSFLKSNKIPLLTVLAKKNAVLNVNGFSESFDLQYIEDYDLWIRMLQNGSTFISTNDMLAAYRMFEKQVLRRKTCFIKIALMIQQIDVKERALRIEKNKALRLWIKKCLGYQPFITNTDFRRMLSCYPYAASRLVCRVLNLFLSKRFIGKIL